MHEADIGDSIIIKKSGTKSKIGNSVKNLNDSSEASTSKRDEYLEMVVGNSEDFGCKGDILQCAHCDFKGEYEEHTLHCREKHPNEKLDIFRYKCNYCNVIFVTLVSLNKHFFMDHPGLRHNVLNQLNTTEGKYKCPSCSERNDNINKLKHHIRSHVKPFQCLYCTDTFSYWIQIKRHHYESHNNEPYEYKYLIKEARMCMKLVESVDLRKRQPNPSLNEKQSVLPVCVSSDEDGILSNRSIQSKPSLPSTASYKMTARKSTGGRIVQEEQGFSYYGCRPEKDDLTKISVTLHITGGEVNISVEKFSKVVNIFPTLLVEDVMKHSNDLP